MSEIDFGRYSEDYAAHRAKPPASVYRRIDAFAPIRDSRSLDLATGPGTIALDLAELGSSVVGIDISAEQIATAQRVAKERNLEDKVDFRVASAESTGLEASSFDLVTAGQCWHWFDSDAVMAEIQRVLRPGGVLAIVYFSYLVDHSPVARASEDLIRKLNPTWPMGGSTGLFPELIDEVIRGGFTLLEQFCYDRGEEFSHVRWRGRMRTSNGVGAGALSPSEVQRFDEALTRLLRDNYPDPMVVEHRLWCVVARTPSKPSQAAARERT